MRNHWIAKLGRHACVSTLTPSSVGQQPVSRFPRRHFASSTSITKDSVIFSGIQPTGVPHLGNWLGALQQWVELQKSSGQLFFSIVDLHAITVPQPSQQLKSWRAQALATLLAIGLDPQRCSLFYQSQVPAHTELMWVLSCTSSLGYLSRMTTWKSKASIPDGTSALDAAAKAKAKLGLLAYPVLQAADILVHGATFVPVGADQVQHLEFARECARNFNAIHGQVLKEPQVILCMMDLGFRKHSLTSKADAARVMSLREPAQKMSKSHPDPRSRILLTDTHDEIHAKVRASLTDSFDGISYDPAHRPGIANLLQLLTYVSGAQLSPAEHASRLSTLTLRALKELVGDEISSRLRPIREAYAELMGSRTGQQRLTDVAEEGAARARKNSDRTIKLVYSAIGM